MDFSNQTINEVCESIDNYLKESAVASIGKMIRSAEGHHKLSKKFKSLIPNAHKHVTKELSDEDLNKIKDIESKLRSVNTYMEYKPYFTKFCNMLDIKPTIIYAIKYNGNTIDVKYEDMDREMIVPNGSTLTHISPNEFGELKPSFRSKTISDSNASRGGYLYSTPRIYITLNKNNNRTAKTIADVKQNVKIHRYTIPENISTIKVDPAIRNNIYTGAGYIETMFPIKVTEVKDDKERRKEEKNNKKEEAVKNIKESFEYGNILDDDYDLFNDILM